jgi:hypothetical protein
MTRCECSGFHAFRLAALGPLHQRSLGLRTPSTGFVGIITAEVLGALAGGLLKLAVAAIETLISSNLACSSS